MSDPLTETMGVALHDELVGLLTYRSSSTSFEFLDSYLETPRRPVLGQIFEEAPRTRWKQGHRLPVWFSNLLPEERMRDVLARDLGINPENEFRLLCALGRDLPGAVTVVPLPDGTDVTGLLSAEADVASAETPEAAPLVRFSLAGVQLKLSMLWSSNTLTLPGAGTMGDYLVKFPSARYEGVPENEYSMMRWAAEVGIDVPEIALVNADHLGPIPPSFDQFRGQTVYTVRRFDRTDSTKVHMEDLNQILGNWPGHGKYEGAGFERLGLVVFTLAGEQAFQEFVRRLTFCIGIGNEDAHLKNWTMWYPDGVTPALSPVYDLVSTIQYQDLDRGLALKMNGTKDPSKIDLDAMRRLARKAGGSESATTATVTETLRLMRECWSSLRSELPVGRSFESKLIEYQRSVPLLAPLVS